MTSSQIYPWFSEPLQILSLDLGKAGVAVELFDFIQTHDEISDETSNVQVYDTRLSLENATVSVGARRFENLFGPDVDEPLKKWAVATTSSTSLCASFVTTNVAPNGKVSAPHTGESWHVF